VTVDCKMDSGSSAECNDGFDVLCVGSSLSKSDNTSNVCRDIRRNQMSAFRCMFDKV
jgi:hypothetical protein